VPLAEEVPGFSIMTFVRSFSVYDGRQFIGRLVLRTKGIEAIDVDGNVLGVFTAQQEAADVVAIAFSAKGNQEASDG
jgi:hypothetical protein